LETSGKANIELPQSERLLEQRQQRLFLLVGAEAGNRHPSEAGSLQYGVSLSMSSFKIYPLS